MKNIHILIVTAITLVIASTGYAASTDDEATRDSPSTMNKSEGMSGMMGGMHDKGMKHQGMMGGMHDKGMMHQGMMGHHMMHSGMSPATVVIYPGMMPMMGHGMMHRGTEDGDKGGKMSQGHREQRRSMMKKHMALMEQRLANIEALLGELVELQKKD